MLNTNQSHKKNSWKYALLLPVLVAFMLLFQIETIAQSKDEKTTEVTNFVASSKFSSIVTKNTTDQEIKELEKTFSDEKYELKISKVKRNNKGEIIGIKLSFDSGKTYNRILERKSTEPIDDIKIFINSDKDDDTNCGFEEISNVVSTTSIEDEETVEVETNTNDFTIDNMVKNGKKVNLIINGKLQSATVKSKIPLDHEFDIFKELNEKDLKSKYNIDKIEGEIYYEITTKKERNSTNSDAVHAVVTAEYSEDEAFSHIDRMKSDKLVDAKKALILFNGKEINHQDLDKIDPKTISSSGNIIASHAMKKYGEKGRNGVIFINTKAYDIENNPIIRENLISKNNSEKPKPKTIVLKNGDVVVVFDGDKIKFPGHPMQYLNQLKLEWQGKILEDNIDFFKNYEFEKIKDLIIIEDEISPKEKKRIKKIIIETK